MTDKERFLAILSRVKREGVDKLKDLLERTDFYTAPASSKYHNNFEGGLVKHSLQVYWSLLGFIGQKLGKGGSYFTTYFSNLETGEGLFAQAELDSINTEIKKVLGDKVNLESVILVSLLHDLHKVNLYEKYDKGVFGGYDERGKKIWNTETAYKTREDALVFGDQGTNSNYIINSCIKLTYVEMLAIENHHGFTRNGFSLPSAPDAWRKSKLALYLHLADMEAAFALEEVR